MPDTNLPDPGTGNEPALTVDAGVEALSDLLKDPDTDLEEEGQEQKAEADGEKPETEEAEDTETETDEKDDGPEDYDSGRFAADMAKVRLKDGTVISVQDLKRGYLSQQSFTRGTTENAKERETLASQKAEVDQTARTLQAQRDFLLQMSQRFLPQPPDKSLLDTNSTSYDPFRYTALKADYDERMGALTKLQQEAQAEQDRTQQELQRQTKEVRDREAKLLLEAMPDLKKPEVYSKFWSEAVDTMAEYGFSSEELASVNDHRTYKIFRDLAAYRRARKNLPAVKQTMQSKPVLTGGKRMDPKAKTSREKQARAEQLRQTGTFDAGVDALMDFDL